VFSTEASRAMACLATLAEDARSKLAVINSGFGFTDAAPRPAPRDRKPVIAYLGTVDFVKMHPGFFDAIDGLEDGDIRVSVWGGVDPAGAVAARARAMRHPERVHFCGQTPEPAIALSGADIFFYPLRRDHYGTAENALVEAMSLGLAPVVMNNPAEMAIVRHNETGLIASSIEECTASMQMLMSSPGLLEKISRNAARHVAETRTAARSAREFADLWQGLLGEPKTICDFRRVVGECPADWFLKTQCLPGETWDASGAETPETASKGALAHFESVFPGDASLSRLTGARSRNVR